MIPISNKYKVWFLITVISMLIVACAPLQENTPDNVSVATQDTENTKSTAPAKEKPANNQTETTNTAAQPSPEVKETIAKHNDEEVVVADNNNAAGTAEDIHSYQVTTAYDPASPTLMGFAINSSKKLIIERFGEPVNESYMNDGSEPLLVYEYPGFIFGFNSYNRVVFIEVNSELVNPGLNDLHVGQKVDQARELLGTPNSLNEYVLIYASHDMIMKLDLDPNTSVIRSIKLFAE